MPLQFLSWRSTSNDFLWDTTLYSVRDASLVLDNPTWVSYEKFLIVRAMQDCKAVRAAWVTQVITVKMSVPYVPLRTALLTFMLFYSSITPKQIPSSSELGSWAKASAYWGYICVGKDPGNLAFTCGSTDGEIFGNFGVWGKRVFANVCTLPN